MMLKCELSLILTKEYVCEYLNTHRLVICRAQMTSASAVQRWVNLTQPWAHVGKEYMFEYFVNQPALYKKWLEHRAGRDHALVELAKNVSLVEYLVASKSNGKEYSTFDLDDLCDYLWDSEKTLFGALKRAVFCNNLPVAQYIYHRFKPLNSWQFRHLVNTAIVYDLPDILEMLLEDPHQMSEEVVLIAMTEGSQEICNIVARSVAGNCGPIKDVIICFCNLICCTVIGSILRKVFVKEGSQHKKVHADKQP
jgi:hypothetical protein